MNGGREGGGGGGLEGRVDNAEGNIRPSRAILAARTTGKEMAGGEENEQIGCWKKPP